MNVNRLRVKAICGLGALLLGALLLGACSSSTSGSGRRSGPPSAASASATPSGPSPTPTTAAPSTSARPTSARPSSTPAPLPGPAGGPVPSGFLPSSATFINAADGWVLGTAPCPAEPCTSVVRTRDGGASWQGIPAPKAPLARAGGQGAAADVSVLRFADGNNGWAAGGGLFSTHDGGASWHPVKLGPVGSLVTALESGGGYVYAAVDECPNTDCGSPTSVFVSPIGSDRFTALAPALGGTVTAAELAVHGADWFAVDSRSNAIYYGHAASAPVRLSGPCPVNGDPSDGDNFSAAAIAVADRSHLDVLCAGDGAAGSARYQLHGTSDGGGHWAANGPSRVLESGLAAMSDNGSGVLLVAAESGSSRLYRSADDGQTLPVVLDVASGGTVWGDAGFTTSTQAFAVLDRAGCYLSRNSGATWTKVTFA